MISNYSRVKLISDKYEKEGGHSGMIGYVIEVYPGGSYEVEFSNSSGITIAQIIIDEGDLSPAPEAAN